MRSVADGTIDLECGSTTASLSRQEQVDFSLMTFIDGGSLAGHGRLAHQGHLDARWQAGRHHPRHDHGE